MDGTTAVEAGGSRRATAARFEVSAGFAIKPVQRWRRRGTLEPDRIGGWKRAMRAAHAERVHAFLAAEPDMTIGELGTRLAPRRSRRAPPPSAVCSPPVG